LAQNVYECMLIYNSNSYARDPAGVGGKVAKMVENCEGEVLVSRLWNEQRLAYPIKGQRKGTYWLTYFRVESTRLTEFKRACRLEDDILRSLTLRVDPRLVEPLVAHAKGERLLPRPGEELVEGPLGAGAVGAGAVGAGADEDGVDEEGLDEAVELASVADDEV
jgi:small subunit ribosomal protein S6